MWSIFMQVLAHNVTLTDLDLSLNNFMENQFLADAKGKNPYNVFK